MKRKIDFNFQYMEWCIDFKCKCGRELTIDDNDNLAETECDKCKRKYRFNFDKSTLIQIKKKSK